eukprot:sb/3464793/
MFKQGGLGRRASASAMRISRSFSRVEQLTNNNDFSRRSANGGSGNGTSVDAERATAVHTKAVDLCYINVSGKQYITTYSVLDRFPNTLLGSSEREFYWIPELKSYFFNRNRECFEAILTYYQTGKEFRPLSVEDELYEEERRFFRIIEKRADTAISMAEVVDDQAGGMLPCCPNQNWKYVKKKVHRFLVDPRSSQMATIWHVVDIFIICISITLLIMETDPNIGHAFTNSDHFAYIYLYYVNVCVISFFTTDLCVRFVTWPNYFSFWKNMFNVLDILSILPFYVSLITDLINGDNVEEAHEHRSYVVLRVCRIFRVIRVFKFIRHSQDLILIIKVVGHAKKELGLLVLLLFIFSVSFGSIMYYIEQGTNSQFSSIMQGCWWAIVTITTIGYGDVVPQTWLGKIVGSFVLTLGIVFLALPMTIIVGKFSNVYEKEKDRE